MERGERTRRMAHRERKLALGMPDLLKDVARQRTVSAQIRALRELTEQLARRGN